MDLVIHPKLVRISIIVLVFFLAGTALVFFWPRLRTPQTNIQPTPGPDVIAAVNAIQAFYTMDYTESPKLWSARLCGYTTEKGCEAVRIFYAPLVRATIEQYKVQTHCVVKPIQLVRDDGHQRIWKLLVTLTNPWSQLKTPTQYVYASVELENGQWLLDRVLFNQEVSHLPTPTP